MTSLGVPYDGTSYDQVAGKIEMAPPPNDARTAVIVVAGQSYAGNMPGTDPYAAQSRYSPAYGGYVTQLDVFNDTFYQATDPLLGTSGVGGSMWTRLADNLIASGKYDNVVLVPLAVGGSSITSWLPSSGSNYYKITGALDQLAAAGLTPTQFIWEQGIADAATMAPATWEQDALTLFDSLRAQGMDAPIYSAINSVPFGAGSVSTPASEAFAAAQENLIQNYSNQGIYQGVNFDRLPFSDYSVDGHFTTDGLTDAANQWAALIDPPQVALDSASGNLIARLPDNGATAVGVVTGDTITPVAVQSLPSDWQMILVGYQANGNTDVVFQLAGNTQIAMLDGATGVPGGGYIAGDTFDPSWKIVGSGDFNGDGNTDLVYQQAGTGLVQIQYLDGNQLVGGGLLTDQHLSGDAIEATGDNKLLFRDPATGDATIAHTNGLNIETGGVIENNTFTSPDWKPLGFADFRAIGADDDLVWQNTQTGDVQIQFLDGVTVIGGGDIQGSQFNANWSVVGFEDATNGADIFWQQKGTGQITEQNVTGVQNVGGSLLSVNADDINLAAMFGGFPA